MAVQAEFPRDFGALPGDALSVVFKHLRPRERVRASLVCKAWLRVEAANPLQHSQLNVYLHDPKALRWHLRDARCLQELRLYPNTLAEFMSMGPPRPAMGRLHTLNIRDVQLPQTYGQAVQLLKLQQCSGLQVLTLQDWSSGCNVSASSSLRMVIGLLPQLTSLSLFNVNLEDPDMAQPDWHPWTQLRRLIIENGSYFPDSRPFTGFEIGGGMEDMTMLTELRIMVPFRGGKQHLENLSNLQRLTLDYEPRRTSEPQVSEPPFLIPAAAKITRLHFWTYHLGDKSLEDLLPLRCLRHLKELFMEHATELPILDACRPQWPMSWSQLSALSSLTCVLDPKMHPYFPGVLNCITSLRRVDIRFISHYPSDELDVSHEYWESGALDALQPDDRVVTATALHGTRGLTNLTSLQLDGEEQIQQMAA